MLKKIKGYRETREAALIMALIQHRANGAALFQQQQAAAPRAMPPQVPPVTLKD